MEPGTSTRCVLPQMLLRMLFDKCLFPHGETCLVVVELQIVRDHSAQRRKIAGIVGVEEPSIEPCNGVKKVVLDVRDRGCTVPGFVGPPHVDDDAGSGFNEKAGRRSVETVCLQRQAELHGDLRIDDDVERQIASRQVPA